MRKMKPSGKGSLLKGLLRALGMNRDTELPLPSQAETQLSVSTSYTSHALKQTAWMKAELAKAQAIMELQRRLIL